MDIVEAYASVTRSFIPQTVVKSKNRWYLRWDRGPEYVEVQLPGTKIGKLAKREKRPLVVSSFVYSYTLKNGRVMYKNITSSYEYNKTRLNLLLDELNRTH